MSLYTTSTETRQDRRRNQLATIKAPAYGDPWTPAQDAELLYGRGTLAERARRVGRTFYAAQRRMHHLRRGKAAA